MTRIDQKILFTALAFLSFAMKGKTADEADMAGQVMRLAELIQTFCTENVDQGLLYKAENENTIPVDALIEKHIAELRDNEQTTLPSDTKTLINIYDQLQQRKSRRLQRDFYANATESKLADLALSLLDEEIEATKHAGLS